MTAVKPGPGGSGRTPAPANMSCKLCEDDFPRRTVSRFVVLAPSREGLILVVGAPPLESFRPRLEAEGVNMDTVSGDQ